tara:strand:+ start:14733 stop:15248 length:516 start_codon:yes stop_codon:yes gene_type:complete
MLNFSTTTKTHFNIVLSCDTSVNMTEDQKNKYLETGSLEGIEVSNDVSWITLRPLSLQDREQAEIKAGSFKKSELGRMLWSEYHDIKNLKDRAYYHDKLSEFEREAIAKYDQYLNECYKELVKASLVSINDKPALFEETINILSPESSRVSAITEIVIHVTRESTLNNLGK